MVCIDFYLWDWKVTSRQPKFWHIEFREKRNQINWNTLEFVRDKINTNHVIEKLLLITIAIKMMKMDKKEPIAYLWLTIISTFRFKTLLTYCSGNFTITDKGSLRRKKIIENNRWQMLLLEIDLQYEFPFQLSIKEWNYKQWFVKLPEQ
jgi:hypothetical protein